MSERAWEFDSPPRHMVKEMKRYINEETQQRVKFMFDTEWKDDPRAKLQKRLSEEPTWQVTDKLGYMARGEFPQVSFNDLLNNLMANDSGTSSVG